ncbi:MAG: excisionase family DNA-binding protein [Planctomycetaceae bacterium]|jgi:excisionase family DNA binding protein|nr:excisionase family DNA-binding protein [Planctomycetaceae bacterium]
MSSEYYTLEEAASVLKLPTAEVNRLREKSSLRAFRDGSSWKFRKSDVDNHLAELIKSRSASKPANESDFDLLSADDNADETPTLLADQQSFDSLMEDGGGLSLADDKMVAAPSEKKKNDLSDLLPGGDEFDLSDDSSIVPVLEDSKSAVNTAAAVKVNLNKKAPSASDVDLAVADDLVPAGGSSVNLAGDSGISLLGGGGSGAGATPQMGSDAAIQFDDEDDILSLVDSKAPEQDHTTTIAIPVEDDFQLTPNVKGIPVDDSESSSQIIALDGSDSGSKVIALDGSDSGSKEISLDTGGPFGTTTDPFGGTVPATDAGFGGFGDAASTPAGGDFSTLASPLAAAPQRAEASYSPMLVTVLVLIAFFLVLPGMMIMDLIRHIWSWGEPFVINSSVMDLVAGMAGLK